MPKKKEPDIYTKIMKFPPRDKENNAPKFYTIDKDIIHQADLLFLPNDKGFKYLLVVVDIGSRHVDAQPIRKKDVQVVKTALKRFTLETY